MLELLFQNIRNYEFDDHFWKSSFFNIKKQFCDGAKVVKQQWIGLAKFGYKQITKV